MIRTLALTVVTLSLGVPLAPSALAQEKPAPPAQERVALVPLKVDLVISRQAGAKKISSMPYSMWVTANAARNQGTSLRMGARVPLPTTGLSPKPGSDSQTVSYSYHNVGTNIDALATSAADGRYALDITLEDSGLSTTVDGAAEGAPVLRNFTSRFYVLLRDGQTAIYTSATDPVTGETLNVQVTLGVLK